MAKEKLKRRVKKFLNRKHSPAGKEYKEVGHLPGYQELHRSRQTATRLSREAAGISTPKTAPTQHTQIKSGPLSFVAWTKKYGYGKTAATVKMWNAYKKNFGK